MERRDGEGTTARNEERRIGGIEGNRETEARRGKRQEETFTFLSISAFTGLPLLLSGAMAEIRAASHRIRDHGMCCVPLRHPGQRGAGRDAGRNGEKLGKA